MTDNNFSKLNSSPKSQKVAIFGAGIAGLAAAHEAVKMGFKVVVYECDEVAGGFARSGRSELGMPTEYSWRGFGPWYHNVFTMMKQIPNRTGNGSVYEKELSRQISFAIVPDKVGKQQLGIRAWLGVRGCALMILILLRSFVADKRGHQLYSRLNASEYLKLWLPSETHKAVISTFGPWIGTDSERTSLHHLGTFHRKNMWPGYPAPHHHPADELGASWYHGNGDGWLILKGPSNEVWFNPWVKELKSQGVEFYFSTKLERLNATKEKVTSAVVFDKKNKKELSVDADYYIVAVTPFAFRDIVDASSNAVQQDAECKKFNQLIAEGPHIQIGFQIGFAEKIKFTGEWQAVILRDSEYCLTIFPDDLIFHEDIQLGENVKSLWTGTVTWSYLQGELTKRTAAQCTKDELKREILYQIFRSDGLDQLVKKSNEGKSLQYFPIVQMEIWSSWIFPEVPSDYMHVTAPQHKWSNTINTQPYHPSTYTSIANLLLAGSHTQVSVDLWSMEGAAESGRRAAFALDLDHKIRLQRNEEHCELFEQRQPKFFHFCSKLDNFLYALGLPNLVDVTLIAFILAIVVCITLSVR